MKKFWDFLFYVITRPYRAGIDRNSSHMWASNLIALIIIFNLATIYQLVFWTLIDPIKFIVIGGVTWVIVSIIFDRRKLEEVEETYEDTTTEKVIGIWILIIIYAVISALSLFYVSAKV